MFEVRVIFILKKIYLSGQSELLNIALSHIDLLSYTPLRAQVRHTAALYRFIIIHPTVQTVTPTSNLKSLHLVNEFLAPILWTL